MPESGDIVAKVFETQFALGARLSPSFTNAFKNAQKQINATSKTAQQANSAFAGFKSTMGKVALAAGGVVGVGSAAALFSKTINEASNLEQYRNTLEIVMKNSAKAAETMRWAAGFANKTPFETGEVVEATVKLSAYGMEAQKVLPLVGDMAGVMGKSMDQAVEAVADAQTGELERLKEFGIKKQDIIDQGNKIMAGKEIVNNKGQIVDQEAFNQALFSLMDERYKGGMEKQSKTFKGTMSTITGVFSSSLAQIAGVSDDGTIRVGSLFDTVRVKAGELGAKMQELQKSGTFAAWGDRATKIMQGVGSAFDWVKNNSNWLIPALYGVVGAFVAFNIIGIVSGLMATYKAVTQSMTIAQWALNAAMNANPLGLVALAIGLVIAAGVALYRNWDTVTQKTHELWVKLKNSFADGANFVIGKLNKIIDAINKITGKHYAQIELVGYDTSMNSMGAFRQMDRYAAGGIASRPSIFGDAGPEMAIPLERTPRSMGLLQQTADILGAGGRVGNTQELKLGAGGRVGNTQELNTQPKMQRKSLAGLGSSLSVSRDSSSITFAPQIRVDGNADEVVITKVMKTSFAEFKGFMQRYENDKHRLQFSPS